MPGLPLPRALTPFDFFVSIRSLSDDLSTIISTAVLGIFWFLGQQVINGGGFMLKTWLRVHNERLPPIRKIVIMTKPTVYMIKRRRRAKHPLTKITGKKTTQKDRPQSSPSKETPSILLGDEPALVCKTDRPSPRKD